MEMLLATCATRKLREDAKIIISNTVIIESLSSLSRAPLLG